MVVFTIKLNLNMVDSCTESFMQAPSFNMVHACTESCMNSQSFKILTGYAVHATSVII